MLEQQPQPLHVASIRRIFGWDNISSDGPAKILVSRSDAGSRLEAWEDDFILLRPDFFKVSLTLLLPEDQIRLFKSAKIIVSSHGSGLTNTFFVCRAPK